MTGLVFNLFFYFKFDSILFNNVYLAFSFNEDVNDFILLAGIQMFFCF